MSEYRNHLGYSTSYHNSLPMVSDNWSALRAVTPRMKIATGYEFKTSSNVSKEGIYARGSV